MKKIIFLSVFLLMATINLLAAPRPDVPEKIKETFHLQFPDIQKAVFYNHGDFYEAYFKRENNITVRLYYNHKGRIDHSIMYYKGDALNPFIKAKLAKEYDGKSVYGVTEFQSNTDHYYQVVLQDSDHWYFVYFDGNQDFYSEKVFNKS